MSSIKKSNNLSESWGFFSNKRQIITLSVAASVSFILLVAVIYCLVYPVKFYDIVKRECGKYGISPETVMAVIWTESKFDEKALSPAGAVGLMQIMPDTARWCAEKMGINFSSSALFDAEYNIMIGVYYFNYLLRRFPSEKWAAAAYNAGEGVVKTWLAGSGDIEFSETKKYVDVVAITSKIYKNRLKFRIFDIL